MRRSSVVIGIGLLTTVTGVGACNPQSCLPSFSFPDVGLPSLHRSEDPITEDFTIQGRVSQRSRTGQLSSLSDATVRVAVDANNDGNFSSGEFTEGQSDSDGNYRVSMEVPAGATVVVSWSADDVAPLHKKFISRNKANVRQNVALAETEPFTCTSGRCATDDNRVSLTGLSPQLSGRARVFNPVTETNNFPGAFEESTGSLLISGVFSLVELSDQSGNTVSTLDTPAELRMEVPRATWNVMKDIHAGSGRIEVPLYSFDEIKGTWVRDGEGFLEDGNGDALPESALASIRDGSYEGTLIACGNVTHFSYWNVDWPVDTKACLRGMILDREGRAAEGATVIARGITYDGYSAGYSVGADGTFCVDVMRSDGPGDDVDQDGITGETQRVRLRVAHRGVIYDVGEFDVPSTSATCENGNCLDVGTLQLSQDNELIPQSCRVTGRVVDNSGAGVSGATVFGMDPSVEAEMLLTLCAQGGACSFVATSGDNGDYEINTGYAEGLSLIGFFSDDSDPLISRTRFGTVDLEGCPTTPVDLVLDEGLDFAELSVSVSGDTIDWTPAVRARTVIVSSGEGEQKWVLEGSDEAGFLPPVTYGQAPTGGNITFPESGTPAALQSGDDVNVIINGTSADGYPVAGSGNAQVP